MEEITLKSRKHIREYENPGGEYLYNLDKRVIIRVLEGGNREDGRLKFIVDEIGKSCYKRIQILYNNKLAYMAQETGMGEWSVVFCSISDRNTLWDFILL